MAPVSAKKGERTPHCALCRAHGTTTLLKGHKRFCEFKGCPCRKCVLTKERRKVMRMQIKIRRQQQEDEQHGRRRPVETNSNETPVLPSDGLPPTPPAENHAPESHHYRHSFQNLMEMRPPRFPALDLMQRPEYNMAAGLGGGSQDTTAQFTRNVYDNPNMFMQSWLPNTGIQGGGGLSSLWAPDNRQLAPLSQLSPTPSGDASPAYSGGNDSPKSNY